MTEPTGIRVPAINEEWDDGQTSAVVASTPPVASAPLSAPAPPAAPLPRTRASAAANDKAQLARSADARRPYHVGVVIGVSAGLYAASLAGVTSLQVAVDRDLVADRQPLSDAIDVLGRSHDNLTEQLAAARDSYTSANQQFSSLAGDMKALHDRLVALRGQVAALDRTAVPGGISLPKLPPVRGGGNVKVPGAPAAAPPPPPPPPTHGKSGPSGGG